MTQDNRVTIEKGLDTGASLRKIAESIGKDPSTVSKEIKKRRTLYAHNTFNEPSNKCALFRNCRIKQLCIESMPSCKKMCYTCSRCNRICPDFVPRSYHCERLDKAPFVCNGCSQKNRCRMDKYYYKATTAFRQYKTILVESRTGINISEADLKVLDEMVTPLVLQGQSPYTILNNHPEIGLSEKTLYNYIEQGVLSVKNIDLPYKLSRKTKSARVRQNKRILGDSISDRPEEAETRQAFGHWEIDTVRGLKKETEPAILTLVERKSRYSIWLKIMSATAASVQEGMRQILTHFGDKAQKVFKTITGDNGSEFAELFRLAGEGIGIYFTHPYSSWEKGTNERHNGLLRRFIPKGKSISGYGTEDILFIGDWANNLPRRILGYKTPEELFEKELDQIYAL